MPRVPTQRDPTKSAWEGTADRGECEQSCYETSTIETDFDAAAWTLS
jgi:hypothetical protein